MSATKNEQSVAIQWFPGHMAKARNQIEDKLKLVDVVIECLDARIPISSQNPMLQVITKQKPKLIILTKDDLANKQATSKWIKVLSSEFVHVIALDLKKDRVYEKIKQATDDLLKEKREREAKRGMKPRPTRAMIVGIPNVGKSTLINALSKKRVANVGNIPGVTKAQQWLRITKDFELLDTPGILWPRFEDQEVALKLALISAIKDHHFDRVQVIDFGIKLMSDIAPEQVMERYMVAYEKPIEVWLEKVAIKLNMTSNLGVDMERVEAYVLKDLQDGRMGRMTWDIQDDA